MCYRYAVLQGLKIANGIRKWVKHLTDPPLPDT